MISQEQIRAAFAKANIPLLLFPKDSNPRGVFWSLVSTAEVEKINTVSVELLLNIETSEILSKNVDLGPTINVETYYEEKNFGKIQDLSVDSFNVAEIAAERITELRLLAERADAFLRSVVGTLQSIIVE